MGPSLQERITAALGTVVNPRTGENIVAAEMVRDVATTREGRVHLTMLLTAQDDATLVRDARQAVQRVAGVTDVRIEVRDPRELERPAARPGTPARTLPVMDERPAQPRPHAPSPVAYPHLGHILAISSGKGGVGKSTVA
ncbi:MAG TPA: iron-sulfur cluster assembly protein, partial [Gemmatimonadaceae bacterium]|nr:iron-sulfur cluster assembly protein [Gemmatimonadaceae bacterium]